MSVLTCNRNSCGNVMCERYSIQYGYICDECFAELSTKRIPTSIARFMASTPAENREFDTEAYFDTEFPRT